MRRLLLILPALLGLAACAGTDVVSQALPPNYLNEAPKILAETDWSSPETISVSMANFEFDPDQLTLRRGHPYRLVFINRSGKDHTVVSDQFFREAATYQTVDANGVATPAPWLSKMVVPAGQKKELWLVAARYGAFRFECDVTGHSAFGMNGIITVTK